MVVQINRLEILMMNLTPHKTLIAQISLVPRNLNNWVKVYLQNNNKNKKQRNMMKIGY